MFQIEKFYGFTHSVNLFSKYLFLSWSCFGFLSLETDAQRQTVKKPHNPINKYS